MYAVILSGGKQYRVIEGQTLKLEKLDAEIGSDVNLQVLMIGNGDEVKIGQTLGKAKVAGTIVAHGRHKKIHIMKFRRRKHHQKQMGHRQYFTEVKIASISA
jgi:large subunit ribosomal protein L21